MGINVTYLYKQQSQIWKRLVQKQQQKHGKEMYKLTARV